MVVLALACGVFLGGYGINRFWTREVSHLTGRAEWIWTTNALEEVHPQAALFVARLNLEMPPPSAVLKVCGDREYVVYINGSPAACGWNRPGFRLDLYDVGHLLRQGQNVVAAEVRSPTPVGGLLLALDVEGVGANVLVSGPAFKVRQRFALGASDPSDVPVPVRWGMPPRYPWGYPKAAPRPYTLDEIVREDPVRVEGGAATQLKGEGWQFTLPRSIFGYLCVDFADEADAQVATAAQTNGGDLARARDEPQPAVRMVGQRRWLDPQPRSIGQVVVFSKRVPRGVEVWPVAEDLSSVAPGLVQGRFGPVPRTRLTIRTPPE
ncbi:MAG: hypothetical protein ACHQHM_02555 [Thermoanaerobaculales bacterium]